MLTWPAQVIELRFIFTVSSCQTLTLPLIFYFPHCCVIIRSRFQRTIENMIGLQIVIMYEEDRGLGTGSLSRTFTTEATSQSQILGLNSYTFRVDGSQVGVLKEGNKVGLGSLL